MPLVGTESAHEEQHHTHADVGEHNAHPDLVRQWVQEGEHTWLGLLRFLDHNRDAQAHEGLREIDHFFPNQGYSQWCDGYVRSLGKKKGFLLVSCFNGQ